MPSAYYVMSFSTGLDVDLELVPRRCLRRHGAPISLDINRCGQNPCRPAQAEAGSTLVVVLIVLVLRRGLNLNTLFYPEGDD